MRQISDRCCYLSLFNERAAPIDVITMRMSWQQSRRHSCTTEMSNFLTVTSHVTLKLSLSEISAESTRRQRVVSIMPPLKGISPVLSPDLLYVLASMGHGDEIVIADANFPAYSTARKANAKLIDMSGHSGATVVSAILSVFPLDQYVDRPAAIMARVPADEAKNLPVPIWDVYQRLLADAHRAPVDMERVERFAFYTRAEQAYAIVATGEGAQYANIILKKGVIAY